MSSLVQISDAATLALHAACLLASDPGRIFSTREVAAILRISEAHLAKVLQRLTRAGFVESVRGPRGGFRLARPAGETTLLEVYEAIEGALEGRQCLLGDPLCDGRCILGNLLETLDASVRRYMAKTRLSSLSTVFRRRYEDATAHHRDR